MPFSQKDWQKGEQAPVAAATGSSYWFQIFCECTDLVISNSKSIQHNMLYDWMILNTCVSCTMCVHHQLGRKSRLTVIACGSINRLVQCLDLSSRLRDGCRLTVLVYRFQPSLRTSLLPDLHHLLRLQWVGFLGGPRSLDTLFSLFWLADLRQDDCNKETASP